MKKILAAALTAVALMSCKTINDAIPQRNPYAKRMFYEKYLNPSDPLDARITQTMNAVRSDPKSASLHNELGQLLRQKGFPKDAEAEFERSVDTDPSFYPAWYNLGLVRQGRGNDPGARFAFRRTLHYKPGHAPALFQMGLIEEQRKNTDAAVEYYAKSFAINRQMLDVRVNPRILDSKLVELALLRMYPTEHAKTSLQFQAAPDVMYVAPDQPAAASPQPSANQIVTPAPPLTSPAAQAAPAKPPL